MPDVVPKEQLLQANTLRELMEPLGLRFAGPALGGLLITVFDVGTAFLVDALTFAASGIVVCFMSRQPPPREESQSLLGGPHRGFRLRSRPRLAVGDPAGAALFLLVTYGPFEVLLPYIIRNDLGGGAATFGTVWRPAAWARSPLRCCSAVPARRGAT